MSFLVPLFLLGALAIAGPVLYHLIRRTPRDRRLFSSLMFLAPSPPRISKRRRLEHLLLLLLRCLALALLAFGFARPFLLQQELNDPTVTLPRRHVLLLDTSASMRREGLWTDALRRVETVLARIAPVDQFALFTYSREPRLLVSFDEWNRTPASGRAALVRDRVGGLEPGWGGTHLGSALVTVAEAFGEDAGGNPSGPRRVVVVSDFQAGSRFEALQAYEWPKGVELVLETVKSRHPTNAGIQLAASREEAESGKEPTVRVRVTNAPEATRDRFRLGVLDGQAGMAFSGPPLDAYVPAGQARVFSVPLSGTTAGELRIGLQGDDEAFDNVVHVIPPVQQRVRVLWFGREEPPEARDPLFFLRRALVDTTKVAVDVRVQPPAVVPAPGTLDAAHLLFVAAPLGPDASAALREQALAGKRIVLVVKDPGIAPTMAALLGQPAVALEEARVAQYAMFAEIDFQHPLFTPFADPRFSDFTKIHVWKYRRLDPGELPAARVVARFDSGDPALVEVPLGQGALYVLTFGWHPEDSQLAVSSKFVPLVWSLLELGGSVVAGPAQHFVGERIPVPADLAPNAVRRPGGVVEPLAAGTIEFTAREPGVHAFVGGARPVVFAANVDPQEGRTAPLDTAEMERHGLPVAFDPDAVAEKPADRALLQAAEAENRQKLWRWFVVATLAVLLAESALAGWTARRPAVNSLEVAR